LSIIIGSHLEASGAASFRLDFRTQPKDLRRLTSKLRWKLPCGKIVKKPTPFWAKGPAQS
jgi:hypothetical protein